MNVDIVVREVDGRAASELLHLDSELVQLLALGLNQVFRLFCLASLALPELVKTFDDLGLLQDQLLELKTELVIRRVLRVVVNAILGLLHSSCLYLLYNSGMRGQTGRLLQQAPCVLLSSSLGCVWGFYERLHAKLGPSLSLGS